MRTWTGRLLSGRAWAASGAAERLASSGAVSVNLMVGSARAWTAPPEQISRAGLPVAWPDALLGRGGGRPEGKWPARSTAEGSLVGVCLRNGAWAPGGVVRVRNSAFRSERGSHGPPE